MLLCCPDLLGSIDHGHEQQGVNSGLPLVHKVLQSQLFGDLSADLEERGQETHELPEATHVALFVRVLLERDVAPPAVCPDHLPVPQTAGLWGGRAELCIVVVVVCVCVCVCVTNSKKLHFLTCLIQGNLKFPTHFRYLVVYAIEQNCMTRYLKINVQ